MFSMTFTSFFNRSIDNMTEFVIVFPYSGNVGINLIQSEIIQLYEMALETVKYNIRRY